MHLQSGSVLPRTVLIRGFAGPHCAEQRDLPSATSPQDLDGAEASSRRIPVPGENPAAVQEAPEGEASAAGHMGEQTPMDTDDGGRIQFGPHPNIILETPTAPE